MCHSGAWPSETTYRVKTSRAHALGIPKTDKADDALPHVMTPVFARNPDGIYVPCNVVWPAFWAYEEKDAFTPIPPSEISPHVAEIFRVDTSRAVGRWPVLRDSDIHRILDRLRDSTRGDPVYVAGGRLFGLGATGTLDIRSHDVARPYAWPIAHDVRPKGQSLGIRGCDDCHATDSPVHFGKVRVGSPFVAIRDSAVAMIVFQDQSPVVPWLFSKSFLFRPWLKVVIILSFVTILGVLLLFGLRGLGVVIRVLDAGGE